MAALELHPLSDEHLEGISGLLEDPGVLEYTMVPVPPPPGFERDWLAAYEQGRKEGTREGFAVVGEHGEFLGLALAFAIDRDGRQLELGYVVAPAARGRGVATEALALLTDWAFREVDAARIELQIAADNEASKRVAERAGYTYEGTRRSVHFKQGRRQDLEVWSRLAPDLAL